MSQSYIQLHNASVRYPVAMSGVQQSAFASLASTVTGGRLAKAASSVTYVEALQNITLSLKPGDRLGLIGRNGAGKSTMLKLLGGLLPPSSGRMESSGQSLNLLALGAGTDGEQSGYENIDRMCRFMDIPRNLWGAVREDIVEFTELGNFLAMPVRTYSAGMSMRLSFGMATAFPREVLVIDEVIGAGDAYFFEKARKRMNKFISASSILVIATHAPGILNDFCNRALFLENGKVVLDGDPQLVWDAYFQLVPH